MQTFFQNVMPMMKKMNAKLVILCINSRMPSTFKNQKLEYLDKN